MQRQNIVFSCPQCSSHLEAPPDQAGREGKCPTCGAQLLIPHRSGLGTRIGGTDPELEYRQPVHAYAAAGVDAPTIVRDSSGAQQIQCPRCKAMNPVTRNSCAFCSMPFALEDVAPAGNGVNGLATASLVLGIIGLPAFCTVILPVLAVVFGLLGLHQSGQTGSGKGLAIAGLTLGMIGCIAAAMGYLFGVSVHP